jgi:hypothetical protein
VEPWSGCSQDVGTVEGVKQKQTHYIQMFNAVLAYLLHDDVTQKDKHYQCSHKTQEKEERVCLRGAPGPG